MINTISPPPELSARSTEAAYRVAMRHSARVRLLKRLIPFGALLTVLVITAVVTFRSFSSVGNLSVGSASLSGSQIIMDSPKLSGYREGTQPYEVTAASAVQNIKNPSLVSLRDITGAVQLEEKGKIKISAKTGLYDSQKEALQLVGDVRVRTGEGYEAQLLSADMDFKSGRIISGEPVVVTIAEGTISANTLSILDNGQHIVFDGRVHAVLGNKN